MKKKTPAPSPSRETESSRKPRASRSAKKEAEPTLSRKELTVALKTKIADRLSEAPFPADISSFFNPDEIELTEGQPARNETGKSESGFAKGFDAIAREYAAESRKLDSLFVGERRPSPRDASLAVTARFQPTPVPPARTGTAVPPSSRTGRLSRRNLAPPPPPPGQRYQARLDDAEATPAPPSSKPSPEARKETGVLSQVEAFPATKKAIIAPATLASAVAPDIADVRAPAALPANAPRASTPAAAAQTSRGAADQRAVADTMPCPADATATAPTLLAVGSPDRPAGAAQPESVPDVSLPPVPRSHREPPPASVRPGLRATKPRNAEAPPSALAPLPVLPADPRVPAQLSTSDSTSPSALPSRTVPSSRTFVGGLAAVGIVAVAGFLAFSSPGTGKLVVSVAGPGGTPVDGVRVYLDNQVVCQESPCVLEQTKRGVHQLSVEANGFLRTADRAVLVESDDETVHNEQLLIRAPQTAVEPAETTATSKTEPSAAPAPPLAPIIDGDSQPPPKAQAQAKTQHGQAAATAPEKAVAKSNAVGVLNLKSTPPSTVTLDGQPLGKTPLFGILIRPGAHAVVFVHPKKGRLHKNAIVKPGERSTVSVRFK